MVPKFACPVGAPTCELNTPRQTLAPQTKSSKAMRDSEAWRLILQSIESAWPASRYRDLGVVVGCSGGADSVSLVHALEQLRHERRSSPTPPRGFLRIAHFNHKLRGAHSEADEDFVRELARTLELPIDVGYAERSLADEQSTRNDRRAFFAKIAQRTGARYIALAHSRDDNVETFLLRLLRGTGPKGMAGIRAFRPLSDFGPDSDFVIARPMLQTTRREIRAALHSCEIPWREDRSNEDNAYRRNWVRNELIPQIESEFPQSSQAIARAIEGYQQWSDVMDAFVEQWMATWLICHEPLTIRRMGCSPVDPLASSAGHASPGDLDQSQPVVIESLRRCWMQRGWPLQAMAKTEWNRAFDALCGKGPETIMLPGAIQVTRGSESVVFRMQSNHESSTE